MIGNEVPSDYVIATGETHTVQEFLKEAFTLAALDPKKYVRFDPTYLRPAEVSRLCGDPSRAYVALGWRPRTHFRSIVRLMLEADVRAVGLNPALVLKPNAEVSG